ncbi:hypothetical protein DFH08DRAFT_1086344 [Mycena albidolilacea]|uniref:Uncharacterized protein n=1 Tax=Mycena albidolilacea TaxID=1033008 RepID=A0AAD6ZFH5_9AGAR|nr:hypothetical protein DFH08DRAFT_1086344 [Mycena albidolilacea]
MGKTRRIACGTCVAPAHHPLRLPGSIRRLPFVHTSIITDLELYNMALPNVMRPPSCRKHFLTAAHPTTQSTYNTVDLCNAPASRFGPVDPLRARSVCPTVRIALPYSPRGTHISLDPNAPPDPMPSPWAGECERCVGLCMTVYSPPTTEDPASRTRYMARKKGVLLPNLTSEAGAEWSRLYRNPPALERVEWLFRESNRAIGEDASDDEGEPAGTRNGGMRASMPLATMGRRSTRIPGV